MTSVFIDKYNKQTKEVMEDLFAECIHIQGHDCFYLPRKFQKLDLVFGEDILSKFDVALPLEILIDNVNGFEGEREMLSKFGMQIKDQINITISKRTFRYSVGRYGNNQVDYRPKEGDLIYIPVIGQLFQIMFTETQEEFFYQLGNLPGFKCLLENFQYSSEEIQTGIEDIDSIGNNFTEDILHFNLLAENGNEIVTEKGSRVLLDGDLPRISTEEGYLYDEKTVYEQEQQKKQILNFSIDNPFSEFN